MKKSSKIAIIIAIVAVVAIVGIVIGIVAGGNKNNSETLTNEKCIGIWKVKNGSKMHYNIETFILYQGGTGKGLQKGKAENEYYVIKWEIKDNILNITAGEVFDNKIGYKINNNTMTSVDGDSIYIKE